MESNQLGLKIRKLRQKLGLSQDDFARKADVAYTTLTKIETGFLLKSPLCLL